MVIAYTAVHQQIGNALLAHLMIYFIAFAKMLSSLLQQLLTSTTVIFIHSFLKAYRECYHLLGSVQLV